MLKKYKAKSVKNTFSLTQIKKLIGKKLLILWKGIAITNEMKNKVKQTKDKLIDIFKSGKQKVSISTMCISGILHVIFGAEILLAIMNIPYTDIKKYDIGSYNIEVIQYTKIPKSGLQQLINT